jgi:hypothetical protein
MVDGRERGKDPPGENMKLSFTFVSALTVSLTMLSGQEFVRIDFVVPSEKQPHSSDKSVIWYDNFDDAGFQSRYAEGGGALTDEVRMGLTGKSLRMFYEKGKRGVGGRKVFFGDTPTYGNKAVRRGEHFEDVYWRVYVKHQAGWSGGGPAKLSRATSIVPPGLVPSHDCARLE